MTCKHAIFRTLFALLLAVGMAACGDRTGGAPRGGHEAAAAPEESPDQGHADEGPGEDEAAHVAGAASTVIPASVARASGIRTVRAGPGIIADEHEVQGVLTPVEGRLVQVTARFPGPVRALRAGIGERVRAGQPLASIESNLSLTTYTVASPIDGVVLRRAASVGATAGEGATLFEVADLSTLWVDLHIFGSDAGHITAGIPVAVTRMSDGVSIDTSLERILPATATASQSTVARARIDNRDGLWRPGASVRARIVVDRADAALAIPLTALQTDEDGRDVVYVREGERYLERAVALGRRDAKRVEVTGGLKTGEQVVATQSFLVKADIGKSSVAHEH